MCADACQADGVDVPILSADVQQRLSAFLPPGASVSNPIDMLSLSTADDYGHCVQTLINADACDAILTIFVPSLSATAAEVAAAVSKVARARRRSCGQPTLRCRVTSSPRTRPARWRSPPNTGAGAPDHSSRVSVSRAYSSSAPLP
jgi:acyl-CoA synthetase (NDP forming)